MAPSVLLIGAGGYVGVPLVEEFIRQKSKFGRIGILVTHPSKTEKFAKAEERGIELIHGSLLESSPYKGFDFAISLVGNALLRLQPAMIDLAVAAGVKHFYPSEYGADLSQECAYKARYFRSKQDTRDHLVATASENPDFHYTLLMTGPFTEFGPYVISADKEKGTAAFYGTPDAGYDVTSTPDVCRYIVESILLPAPEQRREFRLAGEQTTIGDFISTLGRVQGIDYKVDYLDPAEATKNGLERWKAFDIKAELTWAFREFFATGGARYTKPIDNDKFSFKAEDMETALRRMNGV